MLEESDIEVADDEDYENAETEQGNEEVLPNAANAGRRRLQLLRQFLSQWYASVLVLTVDMQKLQ